MTKCHILVGRELPFCLSKTSESEMPLNKKKNPQSGSFNMVGIKLQCSNFDEPIKNLLNEFENSENIILFKQLENVITKLKIA